MTLRKRRIMNIAITVSQKDLMNVLLNRAAMRSVFIWGVTNFIYLSIKNNFLLTFFPYRIKIYFIDN
jgi:hypothetical protein